MSPALIEKPKIVAILVEDLSKKIDTVTTVEEAKDLAAEIGEKSRQFKHSGFLLSLFLSVAEGELKAEEVKTVGS